MKKPTAQVVESIAGDKPYQVRAREALPILVRQAFSNKTIYYSDLAQELNMPNPRNLNYVLGSIGQTLQNLSIHWDETIPPIQCLVINKADNLPGEGVGWFLNQEQRNPNFSYAGLSKQQKRIYLESRLSEIYLYPKWNKILESLDLKPLTVDFSQLLIKASTFRGGGESENHKRLKKHVSENPEIVRLLNFNNVGEIEKRLPSGDCLDVSFETKNEWVAVEVKSSISDEVDIVRGMFQCVKYKAVIDAMNYLDKANNSCRTVLVIEGSLSQKLISIKNILGIEVIENVTVP